MSEETLEQVLEELGLIEKWEKRGAEKEKERLLEQIRELERQKEKEKRQREELERELQKYRAGDKPDKRL